MAAYRIVLGREGIKGRDVIVNRRSAAVGLHRIAEADYLQL
jgi:hypothetical protein